MIQRLFFVILQIFFKHLYTTLAWTYDGVAWLVSLGRWNTWVLSAVSDPNLTEAIEVGCGPGHLQLYMAQTAIPRFGIDPSPQMVRIAGRRLSKAGYPPNLVRGRSQEMSFRSGSTSLMLATFPAEFIYDPKTFSEIYRVLKPGGELRIVAMAKITGSSLPDRLLAGLFNITGQFREFPEDWRNPLLEAGFTPNLETLELESSIVYQIRCKKITPVASAQQAD